MALTSNYPTESLFRGLKTLLKSLPTEEEKIEIIQTLRETRKFLDELQHLIEAFPTIESSRSLSQGLSRLDILADRAVRDAPLRRLMGLKGSQGSKVPNVRGAEDAKSRAQQLEQRLSKSRNSDVAGLIAQSREPVSVLTELAGSLGLRTRTKERKADLTERIATHIRNQQGYRLLRGGEPDSAGNGVDRTATTKL